MYIIGDRNSQNFSEYPLDCTSLVHYTASICVRVHKLSLQLYKSLFWTLHTFNMDITYKHTMSNWYFRLPLQYVSLNWCNSSFSSVLQIYMSTTRVWQTAFKYPHWEKIQSFSAHPRNWWMSQLLWHKRKVHSNYPAAGHTPYVNCGAVSNVSQCSTRVFWSPRCVHSLCGPSLKCGMQLHQKGWFSSGIHCIWQVSHQEWSLLISYVLYPVIWRNCMEHLQPVIHRCKHFHNALCTVECDTCNSCTAAQVNLGFVSIFTFF